MAAWKWQGQVAASSSRAAAPAAAVPPHTATFQQCTHASAPARSPHQAHVHQPLHGRPSGLQAGWEVGAMRGMGPAGAAAARHHTIHSCKAARLVRSRCHHPTDSSSAPAPPPGAGPGRAPGPARAARCRASAPGTGPGGPAPAPPATPCAASRGWQVVQGWQMRRRHGRDCSMSGAGVSSRWHRRRRQTAPQNDGPCRPAHLQAASTRSGAWSGLSSLLVTHSSAGAAHSARITAPGCGLCDVRGSRSRQPAGGPQQVAGSSAHTAALQAAAPRPARRTFPPHGAVCQHRRQGRPHLPLILVLGRAVDVAVAQPGRQVG